MPGLVWCEGCDVVVGEWVVGVVVLLPGKWYRYICIILVSCVILLVRNKLKNRGESCLNTVSEFLHISDLAHPNGFLPRH